jgi:hypothetical protein
MFSHIFQPHSKDVPIPFPPPPHNDIQRGIVDLFRFSNEGKILLKDMLRQIRSQTINVDLMDKVSPLTVSKCHFNFGLQNEIVCREEEARICADQSSIELVVDECLEEVKTSCQIGIEMGQTNLFERLQRLLRHLTLSS